LLAFYKTDKLSEIVAGCDEAGRGCIAGPVVAAALILPMDYHHKQLNDSKLLTHRQRESIEKDIIHDAIDYAIGVVDHIMIDKINILQASILAMHQALEQLKSPFDFIVVDGNKFNPYLNKNHQCIIDGDAKIVQIAGASILAKCYRDRLMSDLHNQYPHYQWDRNKGYPTPIHKKLLFKFGVSPYHRRTYKPVANFLNGLF
jgi:ribonuclease HII